MCRPAVCFSSAQDKVIARFGARHAFEQQHSSTHQHCGMTLDLLVNGAGALCCLKVALCRLCA